MQLVCYAIKANVRVLIYVLTINSLLWICVMWFSLNSTDIKHL